MSDHIAKLKTFLDSVAEKFPEFQTNLESFFDRIGFTNARVESFRRTTTADKSFRDSIWGMIDIPSELIPLIDNPIFQRLRYVSQLGFSSFTYPTAVHTRFDHSLGVYAACRLLISEIRHTYDRRSGSTQTGDLVADQISGNDEQLILRAALLHDTGHGPFSHVTESIFKAHASDASTEATFAGVNLHSLIYHFRKIYVVGRAKAKSATEPQSSGLIEHDHSLGKSLTEIISILIINSNRFRKYYFKAQLNVSKNPELDDLHAISCLILGDPIHESDYALPQLLHGAVDADKIDYMLRDSHNCGISISIDRSRVIRDAGVYFVSPDKDPFSPKPTPIGGRNRVFVIDKFGGDTYEQMGASRLSLYSRVYHHSVTRKLELAFHEHLKMLQVADPGLNELLNIWQHTEVELLGTLGHTTNPKLRESSERFHWRDFYKRALMIGVGTINPLFSTREKEAQVEDDADNHYLQRQISMEALRQLTLDLSPDVLIERAKELAKHLPGGSLSSDDLASSIGLLAGPSIDQSILPAARMIDKINGCLVATPTRHAGYVDAGLVPSNNLIVWSRFEIREIVAITFAIEFARTKLLSDLRKMNTGQSPIRFALPIVDWEAQRSLCKMDTSKVIHKLNLLHEQIPNDPLIWLQIPYYPTDQTENIAEKFKEFSGPANWRVTQASTRSFLQQFPVNLRDEMASFLEQGLKLISRQEIVAGLRETLAKFQFGTHTKQVFLAPLTATSGHQALSALKGADLSPPNGVHVHLENSLVDAISRSTNDDTIILFDDHAASGTQARRQLESYLGTGHESEKNIFHTPLPAGLAESLRVRRVGLAFVYLGEQASKSILDAASQLSLNFIGVQASKNLSALSGRESMLPELREFLRNVGTGCMLNKHLARFGGSPPPSWDETVASARGNSLGYDNAESCMVTALNVPSSTYTALWRPGLYDPDAQYTSEASCRIPWSPLFLRGTQATRRVSF